LKTFTSFHAEDPDSSYGYFTVFIQQK
jgi:hypothetical protein